MNAGSVKQRLKNLAETNGITMQETLTAYGFERTIYRISVSEHKKQFTLKGGMLLYALFDGRYARVTRDIDLLAKNIPNRTDDMFLVFKDIFCIECDDALEEYGGNEDDHAVDEHDGTDVACIDRVWSEAVARYEYPER